METLVKDFSIDNTPSTKESVHENTTCGYIGAKYRYVITRGSFRTTLKKPKLNSYQIKHVSEHITNLLWRSRVSIFNSDTSCNPFISSIAETFNINKDEGRWETLLDILGKSWFSCSEKAQEPEYITLQTEDRKHFSERIKEELKKDYIPFSEAQTNAKNLPFFDSLSKNDYFLSRNQIKNLIKRLLKWRKSKSKEVRSVVLTLIKSIITPRLFGIYVSEEENNRLALSASLIVRF